MCQGVAVDINCWIRQGEKTTISAPNPKPKVVAALRAAIKEVRADDGGDASVAFEVPSPISGAVRGAARVVLGLGGVVVTTLLMALVVVDGDTRSTLLPVIATVTVLAGVFVMIVWQVDVAVTLHRDGRLVRKGWNGVREVDVRAYQRVTVKVARDNFSVDGGVFGD